MTGKEYFRKSYKRPQVKRVKMKIEEAVLTACKAAGVAGTQVGGKNCNHPVSPCQTILGS